MSELPFPGHAKPPKPKANFRHHYRVALDLGMACTGYAVFANNVELVDFGVWHPKHYQLAGGFYKLKTELEKLGDYYGGFVSVDYEAAYRQKGKALQNWMILYTAVSVYAFDQNVATVPVASSLAAKLAVGPDTKLPMNSRDRKQAVVRGINRQFGLYLDPKPGSNDHNIADAISIGLAAIQKKPWFK